MLDCIIEDTRWQDLPLEPIAMRAVKAALSHQNLDPDMCEVSLLACDDARIAVLNTEFRGKLTPTNVLSWPAEDLASDDPGGDPDCPEADFSGEFALGDIAIAWETCAKEAAQGGKPMDDHVTHLIVHGVLHLLGFDHIRDPDATLMEALEVQILGNLGINNPYIACDGPTRSDF